MIIKNRKSKKSDDKLNLLLAELFIDVIPKAMQIYKEEMRHGRGEHLSVSQFRILANINRGHCTNIELAEKLGISQAAISKMVDALVDEGFLLKSINTNDRRKSKLKLSSKGQKLYQKIKKDAQKRMKLKIDQIDHKHVLELVLGLKQLSNHLKILDDIKG